MTQVADGHILSDAELEIATAGRQYEGTLDSRRPDDLVHEPFDVLQHRIAVIPGFRQRGVGRGTEEHGVGAVYSN